MDSFDNTSQQIRAALIGIIVIFTIGILGFTFLETLHFEDGDLSLGDTLVDAIWLTTITLTTVGYGDVYAITIAGRIFTMVLVLSGFGVVAYGLQATATLLVSPELRDLRAKKRTAKTIAHLDRHYIICGNGELVDKTIAYLMESVRQRLAFYDEEIYDPLDRFLDSIFGDDADGHYPRIRAFIKNLYLALSRPFKRVGTLLDLIVVVTEDKAYARHLREDGFLVITGNPTSDITLKSAGIDRAVALMVMLADDTEALLTVLTARSHNPELYITAATLEEALANKTVRVGANHVIRPFELAGQFMNSVTLRPTVYDFFHGILFDQALDVQTTQVTLKHGSQWIGKRIGYLKLRERFEASVIGVLDSHDERFIVAPNDTYMLSQNEDLIIVAPARSIPKIQHEAREGTESRRITSWQKPMVFTVPPESSESLTLEQCAEMISSMGKHFIVCGTDQVMRNALDKLDPNRPFVVISDDPHYTSELLERGFKVVQGDPTHEAVLFAAGVDRALAIMISLEDEADTVLTVLTARSLSQKILITATAYNDENTHKIKRTGADRVISPFNIAAQYVLLATTRPTVSAFFHYVVYNPEQGIETTELYMQDNSPWIGKTLSELRLERLFRAHVIGVRRANGRFEYAPSGNYEINAHEVLVIVTPMDHADQLRLSAHGSETKRPDTLRNPSVIKTEIRRNPLLD